MKVDKYFKSLEELLAENYRTLGFELKSFEVTKKEDGTHLVSFPVVCPCGVTEFCTLRLSVKDQVKPETLAKNILSNTASREHLEDDVEKGLLPPFDYEKHIFKGKLVC